MWGLSRLQLTHFQLVRETSFTWCIQIMKIWSAISTQIFPTEFRERERETQNHQKCPWLNLTRPKKNTKNGFVPWRLGWSPKITGKSTPFPAIPNPRVDFPSWSTVSTGLSESADATPWVLEYLTRLLDIMCPVSGWRFEIHVLGGGFNYLLLSPLFGEDFFFPLIIFRWVGATTKQLSIHLSDRCSHVSSCFTDHVGK